MVLNQNHAPQYPNTLSDSVSEFSPQKQKKTTPCGRVCHFKLSHIAELPSTENCGLPHTQIFSSNILFPSLRCVSMTQQRKHCTFFVCVICKPECVHVHSKMLKQQQLYRENAELYKTKVLLACDGESLHLPDEPELIISF